MDNVVAYKKFTALHREINILRKRLGEVESDLQESTDQHQISKTPIFVTPDIVIIQEDEEEL